MNPPNTILTQHQLSQPLLRTGENFSTSALAVVGAILVRGGWDLAQGLLEGMYTTLPGLEAAGQVLGDGLT